MRFALPNWAQLEAEASRLGVNVFCVPQPKSVKALEEECATLLAEAEKLQKLEAAGTLDAKGEARWDAIMTEETGEMAVAQAALVAAKARDRQHKNLAAIRLASQSGGVNPFSRNGGGIDDGGSNPQSQLAGGPQFRCQTTGRTIQALRANEPFRSSRGEPMQFAENQVRVGEVVASMLTGRSTPEINAMLGGSGTDGGFLLNPTLGTQIVDLARSASVAMRAGAVTVPMETNELHLARLVGNATAQWRPELAPLLSSNLTFDRVTLRTKTLAAIVPVSIELIEDAANITQIIEMSLQAALGLALDQAILLGTGAESQPKGIRNHAGVNTVGSISTPDDYSDVTSAVEKVLSANFPGEISALAWVNHPRTAKTYDALEDTTGQPLQPTPWASQLTRMTTTSLPINEGGGTNEAVGVIGDFTQCVVGMRNEALNIRILEAGEVTDATGVTINAVSQMARFVVAYLRADVALLRPNWFTVLSGITA
jgi:HK97 family phage major capsid protein